MEKRETMFKMFITVSIKTLKQS